MRRLLSSGTAAARVEELVRLQSAILVAFLPLNHNEALIAGVGLLSIKV
jgi:hypothetical protein